MITLFGALPFESVLGFITVESGLDSWEVKDEISPSISISILDVTVVCWSFLPPLLTTPGLRIDIVRPVCRAELVGPEDGTRNQPYVYCRELEPTPLFPSPR